MAFSIVTPVKLGQSAITTSPTTIYTVPVNTRTMIKDITLTNTTSSTINVTVYIGSGATTANALLYQVPVQANNITQWNGVQVINATETIQVVASAAGCTINASGGEAV